MKCRELLEKIVLGKIPKKDQKKACSAIVENVLNPSNKCIFDIKRER